jgi:PAS domain S-box-containing protein
MTNYQDNLLNNQLNNPLNNMPNKPPFKYRFSLAQQIRYGLLLFVTPILLLTTIALIVISFGAQFQQLQLLQQERSRAAAQEIDSYLDDLQRKLGLFGRMRGLTDADSDVQYALLEALVRHNDAYELLMIANVNGDIVTAISPYNRDVWLTAADRVSFTQALATGSDFVGIINVDPITGYPIAVFSIPIRNSADEVDGVLLAEVNLRFLWFVVSDVDAGQTGYAYVVDQRNMLLAETGSTVDTFQMRDVSDAISALHTGDTATRLTSGLRGAEVLRAVSTVPSTSWRVVVELPTSEAYAPLAQLITVMMSALLIAMIGATTAGILYSRSITKPLQALTAAAQKMSTGNLDVKVEVNGRNELGLLASTFNAMSDQLRQSFGEIQKNEQRFRAVFNQTFQLVAVLEPSGRVLEVNQTALEFSGKRTDEVLGKYFWEMDWWISEEVCQQTREAVYQAAQGQFVRYELTTTNAAGELAVIDFSIKPVVDSAGRVFLLVPEGRNITDRKRMEEATRALEVEQAARAASEAEVAHRKRIEEELLVANRELSTFAYIFSHDLRAPLVNLKGFASELKTSVNSLRHYVPQHVQDNSVEAQQLQVIIDTDIPECLRFIENSVSRIGYLTDAMLKLSRIGRREPHYEQIDMDVLVRSILNSLAYQIDQEGIEVIVKPLPKVEFDRVAMEQIMGNILTNAILYLDPKRRGRIEVFSESNTTETTFSVRDNGVGIAKDDFHKVFEPFRRIARSDTPGEGMGLAYVRALVRRFNGQIWFESEVNVGTTFTFSVRHEKEVMTVEGL